MSSTILTKDGTYVLDGGLGSTLQASGHDVDSDPLWSARLLLKNPRSLVRTHEEFIKRGADIVTTASYQASIKGFKDHLQLDEVASLALMENSVLLVKRASEITDRKILIAGSIGPYGACQSDGSEYTGEHVDTMTEKELMDWHRPRMEALHKGGCHIFAIETQPCAKEALAIVKLLKEIDDAKAWLSFSCKDTDHTNGGDLIEEAFTMCLSEASDRIEAIGVNCLSPNLVTPILEALNRSENIPPPNKLPRIVYPNSGEQWVSGVGWMGSSEGSHEPHVEDWDVKKWRDLGAKVIGGCCRVGPQSIAAYAEILKEE